MQFQYGRVRELNNKINKLIDEKGKTSKAPSFKGLLARKNEKTSLVDQGNPLGRIANFVSVIRSRRMELNNADE